MSKPKMSYCSSPPEAQGELPGPAETPARNPPAPSTSIIVEWPITSPLKGDDMAPPIARIIPHPDNPRALNRKGPKFLELVESIRANGVLEPLTVRDLVDDKQEWRAALGCPIVQVLSGHRRLVAAMAAGRQTVPVRNLGRVPDDLAYDIVAMANLHEDLTPLEEGKRAAVWLDKYHEDANAVAAKLGKTEHWVLTHAMIERNLIAAWKQAVADDRAETEQEGQFGRYDRWTAAHWVLIARLPAKIQEDWLAKIEKGYPYNPRDATAEQLAEWLATEKLLLAKAPFDAAKACADCPKRTDAIHQTLFADPGLQAEEAAAVRCLDPKCWQRQAARQVRGAFRTAAAEAIVKHGIAEDKLRAGVIPVSTVALPKDDWQDSAESRRYAGSLDPLTKAFGQTLVTADRLEIVEEGTKGAVPAIVVAGKGKGHFKWVKVKPAEKAGDRYAAKPKTPEELAKEKAEQQARDRRANVIRATAKRILDEKDVAETMTLDDLLYLSLVCDCWPDSGYSPTLIKRNARVIRARKDGGPAFVAELRSLFWTSLCAYFHQSKDWRWQRVEEEWKRCLVYAPFFGCSPEADLQKLLDTEAKPRPGRLAGGGPCPVRAGTGECTGDGNCQVCPKGPGPGGKTTKPKKARKAKAKTAGKESPAGSAEPVSGVCSVCGCTDENCAACIEKTGEPCHWVNEAKTLCSACAGVQKDG